ncbi:biotin/lipoyl-containing protein [Oceanivirga salmonicida]|uniref:biotin/lipoyl-containing protein n=1 Tax=Oceanivirga salmonicida TaxID=1769291 RepID=UPI00082A8C69|nr:biotin/lipoyl-containing protein [Oceanivirga salmonicida]
MIKVYKIKIADKTYEVEVESITEKEGNIETSKKDMKKSLDTSDAKIMVEAPMQGVVLDILVNNGTKVNKGDTLIILEAMKMENQIVAPEDGVVSNIVISKGDTVDLGKVMLTLS